MTTPIIRSRSEHNISRRDIDPDALKVLYRLARSGYTAYLVGGGVRDLLLGRHPKDFDVSTNATPKELRKMFSNCVLVGRRFRLAHLRYGDNIIETSTFRATPKPHGDDLLQTDDNVFGTPEEDALRRDFTVNGLFYDIDTFTVIDYVGGLADLEKKIIRSIGDPLVRFREDPVRMLRAIRFASRLGFTIEEATLEAITVCREEIRKTSRPRLLEEIYRLFWFGAAENSMRLLRQTGMLDEILPSVGRYFRNFAESGRKVEDAPLWGHLRAGDAMRLSEPEEFLSVLYFPLIVEKLGMTPAMMSPRDLQKGYDEVIWPFLDRYGAPRRTRDLVRLIITVQHRFSGGGRKRPNFNRARFLTQGWFPAAFRQFRINCAVYGAPAGLLARWEELAAPFLASEGAGAPDAAGEPARDGEAEPPAPTPESLMAAAGPEPRRKKRHRRSRHRGRKGGGPRAAADAAADAAIADAVADFGAGQGPSGPQAREDAGDAPRPGQPSASSPAAPDAPPPDRRGPTYAFD